MSLESTMKDSRSYYIPYLGLLQTDSTHHRNDVIVILQIFFAFASWIIVEFEIILRNTEDLLYVSCLSLLQSDTTHALYHELSDVRTYVFNRTGCQKLSMSSVFIRHRRLDNSPFTMHNSLAKVHSPIIDYFIFGCGTSVKIFSCNITPFSCYWNFYWKLWVLFLKKTSQQQFPSSILLSTISLSFLLLMPTSVFVWYVHLPL